MKPYYLMLCCVLSLFCSNLFAQGDDRLKIKSGGEEEVAARVYRYPDFKEGKVHFRNGAFGSSRMNFNLLLGEMHFIDRRRDTLALTGLDKVNFIAIEADTFYYDALNDEFLEQVASYGNAVLMVSKKYKYSSTHKSAAYGQYSATQASTSLNNIQADGRTVDLSPDQYALYVKSVKYFMKANGGDLIPVTKGNFLKVFPNHKNAIQNFIKTHKTDFDKEEDLKQLLSFSSGL
ncbi:hypothetical protein [Cesiribacter sp. SM1]|uniref:hypothetical protein n=1 Tax=Cesiribacter sp. SM1 TaxID=2861196 RepID=UPI001CD5FA5E|nr:hypothetical protein [Cesiribacter sp. SM1]